jgi:hypothetical protein
MPFTAPVLNIGQGLANGILSGADSLSKAIDYVRDQYTSAKAAQGAMKALSSMQGPDGSPMVPQSVMDQFNKSTPQGQSAIAGIFSHRAAGMWDMQNNIQLGGARAQQEGAQQRQTNAAQVQNTVAAFRGTKMLPTDGEQGETQATPPTPAPKQQETPTTTKQYQMKSKNGYVSFNVDGSGNVVPGKDGNVFNPIGTNADPNLPIWGAGRQ